VNNNCYFYCFAISFFFNRQFDITCKKVFTRSIKNVVNKFSMGERGPQRGQKAVARGQRAQRAIEGTEGFREDRVP
jgi:hypothetical protein